jgi:hypothetical protein
MTPILTPEFSTAPTSNLRTTSNIDAERETNIIGALLEALNAPGRYRLSERGGELYIEPAEPARH